MKKQEMTLKDKVLKLLPIGTERRMKDLIANMESVGIQHRNSLERKLDELVKTGEVKRMERSHANVWYKRNEDFIADDLMGALGEIIESFSKVEHLTKKRTEKMFGELQQLKIVDLNADMKQEMAEINLVFSIQQKLLENVFTILKLFYLPPELQKYEYYISEKGLPLPKELIDEKITDEDKLAWIQKKQAIKNKN